MSDNDQNIEQDIISEKVPSFTIQFDKDGKVQNKIPYVRDVYYFDCHCTDMEHTVRFTIDEDEDSIDLYMDAFLSNYRNFWKRLWEGLKYAFGHKCIYGHFCSWSLCRNDADRLIKLAEKFRDSKKIKIG